MTNDEVDTDGLEEGWQDKVIYVRYDSITLRFNQYEDKITDDRVLQIFNFIDNDKKKNISEINLLGCKLITDESLKVIGQQTHQLHTLYLIKCINVTDEGIQAVLSTNSKLHHLSISECKNLTVASIDAVIEYCPDIERFDANDIGLSTLPDNIGNLKKLKCLYLQRNNITRLPRSIANLDNECYDLFFDGNPLQEPPVAIANQGSDAIGRYYAELDKGATTSNKLKVVFIGDGEAGKTTILRLLNNQKNPRTRESERTKFLDLKIVHMKRDNADTPLAANCYDCGGQDQYTVSQASFLTSTGLYLLVVKADERNAHNFIRFLVVLQALAPEAVVQIVITKTDRLEEDPHQIEHKKKWVWDKIERFVNRLRVQPTQPGTNRPPLLRIQEDIITVSASKESQWESAKEKISNKIVELTQHDPPLLPTVGQVIPASWLTCVRLIDAVRVNDIDGDNRELFKLIKGAEGEESASAPPIEEGGTPYIRESALCKIWGEYFLEANTDDATDADDINTHAKTLLQDVLLLLQAQGEIFMHDGLVFLSPEFFSEIMKPLLDHEFTLKKLKSTEFKDIILKYIEQQDSQETSANGKLVESLKKFLKTGTLGPTVLPFLWRDTKLGTGDYGSVIRMLVASGIIVGSSFDGLDNAETGTNIHPVVLHRLPPVPVSLERTWPVKCPDKMKQLEIRFEVPGGCPPSLAARFAASIHWLGHCSNAWINGAVVINTEKKFRVHAKLVTKPEDKSSDYLSLAIRTSSNNFGLLEGKFISYIWDFVEEEKKTHLPGLVLDVKWTCLDCMKEGRDDPSVFTWKPGENKNDYCDECTCTVKVGIDATSTNELPVDDARLDYKEFSYPFEKILLENQDIILEKLEKQDIILEKVLEKVDQFPKFLMKMDIITCPYLFKMITKAEYTSFANQIKAQNVPGTPDKSVNISSMIDGAQNQIDSANNFLKNQEKLSIFSAKKTVYLQLLCGSTFRPLVTYKIDRIEYPENIKALAKFGASMCSIIVKGSILLNTAGVIVNAFGCPFPNLSGEQRKKVQSLQRKLKDIDNDHEGASFDDNEGNGLETPQELDTFQSLLTKLEKRGKMCHIGNDVKGKKNRKEWVGKSWTKILGRAAVTLKSGNKVVTYIDKRGNMDGLGYAVKDVERVND